MFREESVSHLVGYTKFSYGDLPVELVQQVIVGAWPDLCKSGLHFCLQELRHGQGIILGRSPVLPMALEFLLGALFASVF